MKMRRSEVLARIGVNPPCMLCHLPPADLARLGKGDAAFLLSDLARQIWGSTDLQEADRIAVNELLAGLLQCSSDRQERFLQRAREVRVKIRAATARSPELTILCEEFFASLEDVEDGV
jgi:hypothetical protein